MVTSTEVTSIRTIAEGVTVGEVVCEEMTVEEVVLREEIAGEVIVEEITVFIIPSLGSLLW